MSDPRRHELPVPRQDRSFGPDDQVRVVERPVSGAVGHALVNADDYHHAVLPRRAAKTIGLRAGDDGAVLDQARVGLLRGGMVPIRRSGTEVEPGGIARQPGLAERHEPGTLTGGLADQTDRLVDRLLQIEENGGRLGDRDPGFSFRHVVSLSACGYRARGGPPMIGQRRPLCRRGGPKIRPII